MSSWLILLFLSFLSCSIRGESAPFNKVFNVALKSGQVFEAEIGEWNFNRDVEMKFSDLPEKFSASICLMEMINVPSPRWYKKCSFNLDVNSSKVERFPLRATRYFFGVYSDVGDNGVNFTVSFSASVCPEMRTGENCSVVIQEVPSVPVKIEKGNVYLFSSKADVFVSEYLFGVNSTLSIKANYERASFTTSDYSVEAKSLQITSPSSGNWFFLISSSEDALVKFTLDASHCKPGKLGSNCGYNVSRVNMTNTEDLVVSFEMKNDGNSVLYWELPNIEINSLRIGVARSNSSEDPPEMYVSWNRSPVFTNGNVVINTIDFPGCNVNSTCEDANAINLVRYNQSSPEGNWIISVVLKDKGDYYIWFKTICPFNCTDQGNCGENGVHYGICSCNIAHRGFFCQTQDLTIEIIIIGITAGVVGLTGLIGLIGFCMSYGGDDRYTHI